MNLKPSPIAICGRGSLLSLNTRRIKKKDMNKDLDTAWEETNNILDEKMALYENVESMKKFYSFLKEAKIEAWLRAMDGILDIDHLKAVRQDISWKERHYKAEAGLLSPEEAAARQKFMDFMNSPCDLLPELDLRTDIRKLK